MDLRKNADGRNRLVRGLLAVVLTVVAVGALRKGKRLTGALAGVGALALGYGAMSRGTELKETLGTDATTEEGDLRCAICGQPIRPGERRGPNEEGETIHDACKASAE